jgi:hypothetical protein
MKIGHTLRTLTLVVAAAMLLMFALAAAPQAPSAAAPAVFRVAAAQAQEAAAPTEGDAAKAAEAAPAEEAAAGEGEAAKAEGEKKEIPHKVGNPSPAQLEDLRRSWDSIPGFDVLLVSILGLGAVVGVIGFGAFKQMKA